MKMKQYEEDISILENTVGKKKSLIHDFSFYLKETEVLATWKAEVRRMEV
jgi:hypothetical protein